MARQGEVVGGTLRGHRVMWWMWYGDIIVLVCELRKWSSRLESMIRALEEKKKWAEKNDRRQENAKKFTPVKMRFRDRIRSSIQVSCCSFGSSLLNHINMYGSANFFLEQLTCVHTIDDAHMPEASRSYSARSSLVDDLCLCRVGSILLRLSIDLCLLARRLVSIGVPSPSAAASFPFALTGRPLFLESESWNPCHPSAVLPDWLTPIFLMMFQRDQRLVSVSESAVLGRHTRLTQLEHPSCRLQ